MTRYLLVRHATAVSSRPKAGLSPAGAAEAEALARRLAGWRFDATWSSDLPRAVETAEAVLRGRGLPPLRPSEALREVEPPVEGISPTLDPSGYAAWEKETTATLAERLAAWVENGVGGAFVAGSLVPERLTAGDKPLALPNGDRRAVGDNPLPQDWERESGPSILVVSHAGPLRVLICLLLGLPVSAHWSFHVDRASLSVVDRCEDMGTLMLLNDRCHL